MSTLLLNDNGLIAALEEFMNKHGSLVFVHIEFFKNRSYFNKPEFRPYLLHLLSRCSCDHDSTALILVLPNYCNDYGRRLVDLEVSCLAVQFFAGDGLHVRCISEVNYLRMLHAGEKPDLMSVCPCHAKEAVERLEVSAAEMLLSNAARLHFKGIRRCSHQGTDLKEVLEAYRDQTSVDANELKDEVGEEGLPYVSRNIF